MKQFVLRLTQDTIFVNEESIGCWKTLNDAVNIYEQIQIKMIGLSADSTIKIIDDRFSELSIHYWTIFSQVWAYEWAKYWQVQIRQTNQWLAISQTTQWCDRRCYGIIDKQVPVLPKYLQKILINNEEIVPTDKTIWTITEEYLFGCQITTYLLNQHMQLTVCQLRAVTTDKWLGYRLILTAKPRCTLMMMVTDELKNITSQQMSKKTTSVCYTGRDRLIVETEQFRKHQVTQKYLWQLFWERFEIRWESEYRWAMFYRRLIYQAYLVKRVDQIEQLLWAPIIDVTGDFAYLKWQRDWQAVLTGFLRQLIGGYFYEEQLIINGWPQLPLSGQRTFKMIQSNRIVKIRMTTTALEVQPSKPLIVINDRGSIQCQRQCWTTVWASQIL